MGLEELVSQQSSSSSTSSGSSGSGSTSSSSSSSERRYDDEVILPMWAIIEDDDGGYLAVHRDPRANIIMRDGEVIKKHKRVEEHWTSSRSFRTAKQLVDSELGMDFLSLLRNDAETALKAYREAQKCADPSHNSHHQSPCMVCGESIHVVFTDYVEVEGQMMCADHTADELKEANYL